MGNSLPPKEQIYIDFIEKIISNYPYAITIIGIISCVLIIYLFIIMLLSIAGFFKGYKVSFFPPSFDPSPAINKNMDDKIDTILKQVAFLTDIQQKNSKDLSNKIDSTTDKISELLRLVNFVSYRIDHIERQTILPNYRVPELSALATIDNIFDDLDGKIVLVKLDLDIPFRDNSGMVENHIKFRRSILTIEKLLSKNVKILLLIGQGVASVDQFETDKNDLVLTEHAARLQNMVGGNTKFIALDKIPPSKGEINITETNEVLVLPNLAKISPEDRDTLKYHETILSEEEIINSTLVLNTKDLYDVFVLDDFRSTIKAVPSNIGLSTNKVVSIGKGLEQDIIGLNELISQCIKFGKKARGKRICICGSSRPCDIIIIETVLSHNLFDRVLLGPITSIVIKLASDIKINDSNRDKLAILAKKNNYDLDYLVNTVAKNILENYSDRIIFPQDFLVDNGDKPNALDVDNFFTQDKFVESIGPSTLSNYIEEIKQASLVFHFGMLGHSRPPYSQITEKIISTYAKSSCVSIMAGDHIAGLAHKIGVERNINFIIRGAKTTSFYLTNQALPGLDPFIKQ